MIRHEQAGHHFAFQNMPFHDLRHIGFCLHAVPHALRVHHNARSLGAMVQTARLIRADDILQIQALRLRLEAGM